MSRMRTAVLLPVVTVAIYAFLIQSALRDAKRNLGRRWWPGPPIDYP